MTGTLTISCDANFFLSGKMSSRVVLRERIFGRRGISDAEIEKERFINYICISTGTISGSREKFQSKRLVVKEDSKRRLKRERKREI